MLIVPKREDLGKYSLYLRAGYLGDGLQVRNFSSVNGPCVMQLGPVLWIVFQEPNFSEQWVLVSEDVGNFLECSNEQVFKVHYGSIKPEYIVAQIRKLI